MKTLTKTLLGWALNASEQYLGPVRTYHLIKMLRPQALPPLEMPARDIITHLAVCAELTVHPSDFKRPRFEGTFKKLETSGENGVDNDMVMNTTRSTSASLRSVTDVVSLMTGASLARQIREKFIAGWDCVAVDVLTGGALPAVSGARRTYVTFRPEKAILREQLTFTFRHLVFGETSATVIVESAGDLVITQAFVGNQNVFPNAGGEQSGINGAVFAATSTGNAICWPRAEAGRDVQVRFAVLPSVISRVAPPSGYTTSDLVEVKVEAHLDLLGPLDDTSSLGPNGQVDIRRMLANNDRTHASLLSKLRKLAYVSFSCR